MKCEIMRCDLCEKEITDTPFIVKTRVSNQRKQVGCDLVITPPGSRLYALGGKAMLRMNASFYCGRYPPGTEELHFHSTCLDREVKKRMAQFFD